MARKKLTPAELELLFANLELVYRSGLPLTEGFDILKSNAQSEEDAGLMSELYQAALSGGSVHDVLAGAGEVEEGVGDGGGPRGDRQGRDAALEGCHALFQHLLGRVGETAVDVPGVGQVETARRLRRILEHEGCGLVNRHRPRPGRRIRLLLPDMHLFGFKPPRGGVFVMRHAFPLSVDFRAVCIWLLGQSGKT
jgi:hypothetical protein